MIVTYHNFESHAFTVCYMKSSSKLSQKILSKSVQGRTPDDHALCITGKLVHFSLCYNEKTCKHHSISTDTLIKRLNKYF